MGTVLLQGAARAGFELHLQTRVGCTRVEGTPAAVVISNVLADAFVGVVYHILQGGSGEA